MLQRSVKLQVREGRLSLRWSYQRERYYLALGLYDNSLARKVAQSRANQIAADLVTGNFDPTLQKYKGEAVDTPNVCGLTAVELFDRFTKQRNVDSRTLEKYSAIRAKLRDYFQGRNADIDAKAADEFRRWLDGFLAPISQKEYIGTIATCWTWAVKQDLLSASAWVMYCSRLRCRHGDAPGHSPKTR